MPNCMYSLSRSYLFKLLLNRFYKKNSYKNFSLSASEQLDLYQEKALEYSRQNKQLRREINNEKFHKAREDDDKRYPSL